MIHTKIDKNIKKGWFVDPWNSKIKISIGYANEGINENYIHSKINEVYLIAKGTSTIVVDKNSITLREGDIMVVKPGETHTFVNSSEDYLHFVIHTPFVKDDKQIVE